MNDLFTTAEPVRALELRPYQLEAIDQVRGHIRAGKKNILLCAPTGSGKTVVASHIISESDRKMRKSAFVVDLTTLVAQTSETFDAYGIDHGVIQAQHPRYRPWKRVQICSAQTIDRRGWPETDLIVVDEAHAIRKCVVDRVASRDTVTIGLTATPFTKGLGKIYDALVNVTTTAKLIEDGFLSPYRIFAAVEPDMTGVKIVAGEWVDTEASKKALEVVGDVVLEYTKHGEGRKFICSACDVAHVQELARQFLEAGINVATYTYKDTDEQRADIVTEFRKPHSRIRGLITVTAASKGFDVPDIGCVIMARPLRNSLAEHIQFFGRGLRIAPGKKDCIVLDHSGNCARFWDEWNEFFETGATELDDGKRKPKKKKKQDEAPQFVKCPQCKHLHKPAPRCSVCGFEHPRRNTVQHVEGQLSELIASGNRSKLTSEVWPQVVGYVRKKRGDAGEKMAKAIYFQITGTWPKANYHETHETRLTSAVEGRIRACNKAYRASLAAAKQVVERAAAPVVSEGDPPW